MTINHLLRVRTGDALSALREFLAGWWVRNRLEALLAPVETTSGAGNGIQVIEEPAGLAAVNPFAPVMHNNVASVVAQMAEEYAGARVAALLRPCELRALVELRKRRRTPGSGCLVLVGVDCLGTFPPPEYERRLQAQGVSQLINEALSYAAEGGFTPQRLRTACQMCDWPATCGADLTIGAIGVAPDQYLLVIARDEATDAGLHLGDVTDGLAEEAQIVRREVTIGNVAEKRARARAQLLQAAAGRDTPPGRLYSDLGSILAWFSNCSLCGDCLDACPLYDGELGGLLGMRSGRLGSRPLLAELVQVSRWLASCSGCGMCEQACSNGVPLMLLVAGLSHRIRDGLRYQSGDATQPLPWLEP